MFLTCRFLKKNKGKETAKNTINTRDKSQDATLNKNSPDEEAGKELKIVQPPVIKMNNPDQAMDDQVDDEPDDDDQEPDKMKLTPSKKIEEIDSDRAIENIDKIKIENNFEEDNKEKTDINIKQRDIDNIFVNG